MRYTVTFLEGDYELLTEHLSGTPDREAAAYLICRLSRTASETRLLVREVAPVRGDDVIEASAQHMKLSSASFRRAMKTADRQKGSFGFVHSHPPGNPAHSVQDDKEEATLFRSAYARIRNDSVQLSLIFCEGRITAGRVWLEDGSTAPISFIRVIGNRFRFQSLVDDERPIPEFFDRQVRAFGPDVQRLLSSLTVGVVGVGGTGSAVLQQLARLGVGQLVVADGETFEASNVNRVYASRTIDQDIPKVKLAERFIADVGLSTGFVAIDQSVTRRSAFEGLRDCDVVFGCTDDYWGRSLLSRLAVYYAIPVFDLGVKISSVDGEIGAVEARCTTLMPGTACLYCRGRITAERVAAQSIRTLNPDRAERLAEEGYIPELEDAAPAVIPFTTAVASTGIAEFLNRLTGYRGETQISSEVLLRLHEQEIRTNTKRPKSDCFCADTYFLNRGDASPLLDTVWPQE